MYNEYDFCDTFQDSNKAVNYKEGNIDILCMNFLKMMDQDQENWIFMTKRKYLEDNYSLVDTMGRHEMDSKEQAK